MAESKKRKTPDLYEECYASPFVNYSFKRIFSDPEIVRDFLKLMSIPAKEVKVVSAEGLDVPPSATGCSVILDFAVELEDGTAARVQIQRACSDHFGTSLVLHGSSVTSSSVPARYPFLALPRCYVIAFVEFEYFLAEDGEDGTWLLMSGGQYLADRSSVVGTHSEQKKKKGMEKEIEQEQGNEKEMGKEKEKEEEENEKEKDKEERPHKQELTDIWGCSNEKQQLYLLR